MKVTKDMKGAVETTSKLYKHYKLIIRFKQFKSSILIWFDVIFIPGTMT